MDLRKYFLTIFFVSVFSISSIANAAIVSANWKVFGDNLITQDTTSGLNWLDLTETNDLSHNYVSGQLGTGGQFDGWRYATNAEVVSLWSNFNIDLSTGVAPFIAGLDPNIAIAASFLGNTICAINCGPANNGALGSTSEFYNDGVISGVFRMGAYTNFTTSFYNADGAVVVPADQSNTNNGHYLVTSEQVGVVPVPATVWLFGSGLLGLIGVAKRKKA